MRTSAALGEEERCPAAGTEVEAAYTKNVPRLTQRFDEALVFAARLHAGDIRQGTTIPYLAHLLGTASIALEHGATEDEAIAALLHDAVEDHGLERPKNEHGDDARDGGRGDWPSNGRRCERDGAA